MDNNTEKRKETSSENSGGEALSAIVFMIIVMIGMYFLSKYMGN